MLISFSDRKDSASRAKCQILSKPNAMKTCFLWLRRSQNYPNFEQAECHENLFSMAEAQSKLSKFYLSIVEAPPIFDEVKDSASRRENKKNEFLFLGEK